MTEVATKGFVIEAMWKRGLGSHRVTGIAQLHDAESAGIDKMAILDHADGEAGNPRLAHRFGDERLKTFGIFARGRLAQGHA